MIDYANYTNYVGRLFHLHNSNTNYDYYFQVIRKHTFDDYRDTIKIIKSTDIRYKYGTYRFSPSFSGNSWTLKIIKKNSKLYKELVLSML